MGLDGLIFRSDDNNRELLLLDKVSPEETPALKSAGATTALTALSVMKEDPSPASPCLLLSAAPPVPNFFPLDVHVSLGFDGAAGAAVTAVAALPTVCCSPWGASLLEEMLFFIW